MEIKLSTFPLIELPFGRLSFYLALRDLREYIQREWAVLMSPDAYSKALTRLLPIPYHEGDKLNRILGSMDPSSRAFKSFQRDLAELVEEHSDIFRDIESGEYGPVSELSARVEFTIRAIKIYSRMVAVVKIAAKLFEEEHDR